LLAHGGLRGLLAQTDIFVSIFQGFFPC
jgi:hypothetical protein